MSRSTAPRLASLRQAPIHPAHCPCGNCRPPAPGERTEARGRRLVLITIILILCALWRLFA